MAENATIYRFTIDLTDLDRNVYEKLSVHVALHPSETLERMAMRVLAYCLNYDEQLSFTKGLSSDSEPDLWHKSYSDEIELWLELGLPDAKRIKKACSQSKQVKLYAYGGQGVNNWWDSIKKDVCKQGNITIYRFDLEPVENFAKGIARTTSLSCMIQDGSINLSWADQMQDITISEIYSSGD